MILFFGKRIRILPDHRHHSAHIIFLQERKGVGDHSIRPVIRWGDRAITVPSVDYKIVDRILHCTFTLSYIDSADVQEQYPLAETLEADIITPQGRVTSGIT